MESKSNKAFSLFEVMVAVMILSTALVFIFRSFTSVLTVVKLSRNLTLACWLAEEKMWEASLRVKGATSAFSLNSSKVIQGLEFSSLVSLGEGEINSVPLEVLKCEISWSQMRTKKDNFTLFTYLAPRE